MAELEIGANVHRRCVEVDGLRFTYLEAGVGRDVVLLHSGEFGASAQTSWGALIPLLAHRYRVIAPDWLGYGDSSKVFDFENNGRRRLTHLRRGLETIGANDAHFVGTSVGGTMLLQVLTKAVVTLPMISATLISSGGPMPASPERQVLTDYDGTLEAMRAIVRVLFHDSSWAGNNAYVEDRWRRSRLPGAWEAIAAARLRAPDEPSNSEFGRPDTFNYESIGLPVLVIGGAEDKLKPRDYLDQFVPRIPHAKSLLIEDCGHCANVEHPQTVRDALLAFFEKVEADNAALETRFHVD